MIWQMWYYVKKKETLVFQTNTSLLLNLPTFGLFHRGPLSLYRTFWIICLVEWLPKQELCLTLSYNIRIISAATIHENCVTSNHLVCLCLFLSKMLIYNGLMSSNFSRLLKPLPYQLVTTHAIHVACAINHNLCLALINGDEVV